MGLEHGPGDPPVPRVSIGLPVFNGERYLAQAITSILSQSYHDLELIICDNASTDTTGQICREFALRDPRLRYYRNAQNLGAAPNYNLCFRHARGTYFKWAAHDDCLGPDYLARAVAALDAAPEAVLCTTGIQEIGAEGEVLRVYRNSFPGIESPRPSRRFAAVIHRRHQCEDFFGLFRRAALEGSELHGAYNGSDRVLLAEMALRGPWVGLPDPLFLHREHDQRYTRAILLKDRREASRWQDTRRPQRLSSQLFHLLVYWNLLRVVGKAVPVSAERLACYAELVRWWFTDEHSLDILRDAVKRIPGLQPRMRAAKLRLLGKSAAPPGSLPGI